jgi:hypothetical protein
MRDEHRPLGQRPSSYAPGLAIARRAARPLHALPRAATPPNGRSTTASAFAGHLLIVMPLGNVDSTRDRCCMIATKDQSAWLRHDPFRSATWSRRLSGDRVARALRLGISCAPRSEGGLRALCAGARGSGSRVARAGMDQRIRATARSCAWCTPRPAAAGTPAGLLRGILHRSTGRAQRAGRGPRCHVGAPSDRCRARAHSTDSHVRPARRRAACPSHPRRARRVSPTAVKACISGGAAPIGRDCPPYH